MDCRLQGRINRGWNRAYGSILPFSCLLRPYPSFFALIFLHDFQPPSTATAAELPPSWFKMTGSLASLRRLMGWQAPGLTCKVKSGAASLANMRLGDFDFFAAYALAGQVLLLSSFSLTLLEYYGLQLQHLSPNSIALVAIFIHLCEMYVGVRQFPLAGGNGGEKTGRWCRRMSTTGSHFPSVARPSIVPSGGNTPAWSRVSAPCWIGSST
jgi:hypothetical protein